MKSSVDVEPPLFPPGTVLRPKTLGAHAFVILGRTSDERQVLAAAWTSLDEECPDDDCLLDSSDHPEISHPSALALSRARLWEVEKLLQAVESGLIKVTVSLGSDGLKRIVSDARKSRNLRREWKTLLP